MVLTNSLALVSSFDSSLKEAMAIIMKKVMNNNLITNVLLFMYKHFEIAIEHLIAYHFLIVKNIINNKSILTKSSRIVIRSQCNICKSLS